MTTMLVLVQFIGQAVGLCVLRSWRSLASRAARDSLLRGVLAADGDPASFPVGRSAGEAVPAIESGRTLLVFSDGMRVARPIAGSSDPSALPARFSGVI